MKADSLPRSTSKSSGQMQYCSFSKQSTEKNEARGIDSIVMMLCTYFIIPSSWTLILFYRARKEKAVSRMKCPSILPRRRERYLFCSFPFIRLKSWRNFKNFFPVECSQDGNRRWKRSKYCIMHNTINNIFVPMKIVLYLRTKRIQVQISSFERLAVEVFKIHSFPFQFKSWVLILQHAFVVGNHYMINYVKNSIYLLITKFRLESFWFSSPELLDLSCMRKWTMSPLV